MKTLLVVIHSFYGRIISEVGNNYNVDSNDEVVPLFESAIVLVPGQGCFTVIWPHRDGDEVIIFFQ